MKTLHVGQTVWWYDPANQSTGRYTVLELWDAYGHGVTEASYINGDSRTLLIGNGYSEAEVYACEVSPCDATGKILVS